MRRCHIAEFSKTARGRDDTHPNERSCDYFAKLENGQIVKLKYIIVDFNSNAEFIICQALKTRPHKYSKFVLEVIELSQEFICNTKDIRKTCVFVETPYKNYVIPTPNQLFY